MPGPTTPTMEVSLNPMWSEARRRLEAFWFREVIDRPCLQVYAPAREQERAADTAATADERESVFQRQRAAYLRTRYLGEALPVIWHAWEGIAEMLGARVERSVEALWVLPFARKLDDIDLTRIDLGSPIVQSMLSTVELVAARGAGECFVGHPMHLGNPGDTLAKLRGYNEICLDLYDDMNGLLRLEEGLARIWNELYDRVYDIVNTHMQGSCGWLPCWHPRRAALIEFDFCGMISSEHFTCFIPALLARASHVEHAIYHLDGPVALRHLEAILALKEISAVQAQPGVGVKDPLSWMPIYRRIQEAGKSLYVGCDCSPAEARVLVHELNPAGLMVPVRVSSEEEGLRFLDEIEKR